MEVVELSGMGQRNDFSIRRWPMNDFPSRIDMVKLDTYYIPYSIGVVGLHAYYMLPSVIEYRHSSIVPRTVVYGPGAVHIYGRRLFLEKSLTGPVPRDMLLRRI